MNTLQIQFYLFMSSLLLLTVLSGSLYVVANHQTSVSYVMQPGIYLEINQEGNVSRVETQNTDAEMVLGDLQLLNLSIESAIALTHQQIEQLGFHYGIDDIE